MTPTPGLVVTDSSAIVAFLTDQNEAGRWARGTVNTQRVAAPRLMMFEVGNTLRRQERGGALDAIQAQQSHAELCAMRVLQWPHRRLAARAWELRHSVTYYDATYVALAELLDAPLVTLDQKLARAHGPRCAFLTPPA